MKKFSGLRLKEAKMEDKTILTFDFLTKTHPIECEIYKQSFCGSNIGHHVNSVHKEQLHPFKCSRSECFKTFSTKNMMNMHIATVHEGHTPFDCTICERRKLLHGYTEQRLFECPKCSKTFSDIRCMKTHMLTVHEG